MDSHKSYFRYIPVRQRDIQWGLYVTGVGCTKILPGAEYPPRTHPKPYDFTWQKGRTLPEYQVIYITAGEGVFESAPTGRKEIAAGDVILLFPDVWHRYHPAKQSGWDEWWVSFDGEYMDRLLERRFFSPEHAVLTTGLEETILRPFESLLQRVRSESTGFPHLISADTLEILGAVLALAQPESAQLVAQGPRDVVTVEDRMVAEAMHLIWGQSHEVMTVDDLARQLPVTRRSLERRFRKALGHTILEEITRCRTERATRLLAKTSLSIKEVASAAGFPNTDAMSRVFHRAKGMSPRAYRREHGKE
ncbi:MAG: hypothetical protein A2V70_05765 [Planctomycetes bacterium RBG_13_63_9]|nr:MAG: hypothetical protein A2V70_05765 [Planctomycetes bacterium RBG_13_63_9]